MKETFTIYDAQQQPTNSIGIRGIPLKKGEFRMVVTVLIFNEKNELLIQQRAKTKDYFPNLWDFSASGQVLANELIFKGAEREVCEELGILLDLSNTPSRLTCSFEEGWDHYFFVQTHLSLDELTLQKEEVQQATFVDQHTFLQLVETKQFIPYIFNPVMFDLFYQKSEHQK
ncbi:NUDIX hydrolase [Vagococcus sp. JNUCC 83]